MEMRSEPTPQFQEIKKINRPGNLEVSPVITIDGVLGTGRYATGKAVATALGLQFVGDEILDLAAQRLGVHRNQLAARRETLSRSFPLSWSVFAFGLPIASSLSSLDYMTDRDVFEVEREAISDIMHSTSCVIAGWQAGRLVAGGSGPMSVFLHAQRKARIDRIKGKYGLCSTQQAQSALDESDFKQHLYYKQMIGQDLDQALNYQLTIDTTMISATETAQLIVDYLRRATGDKAVRKCRTGENENQYLIAERQ
jgi:cytidylate kinase